MTFAAQSVSASYINPLSSSESTSLLINYVSLWLYLRGFSKLGAIFTKFILKGSTLARVNSSLLNANTSNLVERACLNYLVLCTSRSFVLMASIFLKHSSWSFHEEWAKRPYFRILSSSKSIDNIVSIVSNPSISTWASSNSFKTSFSHTTYSCSLL